MCYAHTFYSLETHCPVNQVYGMSPIHALCAHHRVHHVQYSPSHKQLQNQLPNSTTHPEALPPNQTATGAHTKADINALEGVETQQVCMCIRGHPLQTTLTDMWDAAFCSGNAVYILMGRASPSNRNNKKPETAMDTSGPTWAPKIGSSGH